MLKVENTIKFRKGIQQSLWKRRAIPPQGAFSPLLAINIGSYRNKRVWYERGKEQQLRTWCL